MRRRARILLVIGGSLAALVVILAITAAMVAQTRWFHDKVRDRMVAELERASGGEAEIAAFHFDWSRLRAEVRGFVLHGTEGAGQEPLLRIRLLAVGLKIVSVFKRDIDIQYLEVSEPRVHVILYPDGRTNVPEPKVKRQTGKTAVETILELAVGRFQLDAGWFHLDGRGTTPFSARGQKLRARFDYEMAAPRYRGNLRIEPLDFQWGVYRQIPLDVDLNMDVERNRIAVTGARLATGRSEVRLSGALDDLGSPTGNFQYRANLSLGELGAILKQPALQRGDALVEGAIGFGGPSRYEVTGSLHAGNVAIGSGGFRLAGAKADGRLKVHPKGIDVHSLRFSGTTVTAQGRVPAHGRVENLSLVGRDLTLRGIQLNALGGRLAGNARIDDFNRYRVEARLSNFNIATLLQQLRRPAAPWNGRVSGPLTVQGSLRDSRSVAARARLEVTPADPKAPVQGQVDLTYDARRSVLDLGRSYLSLPHTQVRFWGGLGDTLGVHFESTNLEDLLPVLGGARREIPVNVGPGGRVVFDGTVAGRLENPRILGQLSAGNLAYSGRQFDSLTAAVEAAQSGVTVREGQLVDGGLRADFSASLGLFNWRTRDASPVTGSLALRNAALKELAALAGRKDLPAEGTLSAAAQVSGTIGAPRIDADLDARQGAISGEPFDRLTAKLNYAGNRAEAASAQMVAGAKRVDLKATYQHAPGSFTGGRLSFQVMSNELPLEQFQTLRRARPGLAGVAQLQAAGTVQFKPGDFAIDYLNADLSARNLQMNESKLGNVQVKAQTDAGILSAQMGSDLAGSKIQGQGRWRLAGDYPGEARVSFERLDLGRLRDLIAPRSAAGGAELGGVAEGTVTIEGPVRRRAAWTASLTMPRLELRTGGGAQNGARLVLRNEGPIGVRLERNVVKIQSAHLVGKATDLAVSGSLSLANKNPLDLRVNGKIDLALLADWSDDIQAEGLVALNASVRGDFRQPAVNGRLELENASFNAEGAPVGLYNARGAIVFNGNRATIERLTAESGGGRITVTGFVGYSGGFRDPVFRLAGTADDVRVRYPEGVSTVADASIQLTGTSDRSMLSGSVTIQRTGFNPQSDFSSILARTAEPVRTPSPRAGLLANMNLDVRIQTAPDITFQSALTQDIQAEANLRLRGTARNPALLGRVNITEGELTFMGTKYVISQGSVNFYNPVRIEPILNVDLETRARGIDITLTISGPINKLNLTPRSDPPLQFSEIISLLATGRAPTSDPTLLARQSSEPMTWQQMGASALVGQAIANPIAGRLQRFFGITKLKIDPALVGVENNPQARLNLEQQITKDITFTYITNVTQSNPQVVRVEWAFHRNWSVVAVREENGLFGLDFLYKKRFR